MELAENRSKEFFSSKIDELKDLSCIFEDRNRIHAVFVISFHCVGRF